VGVKSNWVHSALRPPIGLLCQPQVIMMKEKLEEWLAGETEVLGELGQNLPQWRFYHQKPHSVRMRSRAAAVGSQRPPTTHRLSYGTALSRRFATKLHSSYHIAVLHHLSAIQITTFVYLSSSTNFSLRAMAALVPLPRLVTANTMEERSWFISVPPNECWENISLQFMFFPHNR
jgi:hypothetical protein